MMAETQLNSAAGLVYEPAPDVLSPISSPFFAVGGIAVETKGSLVDKKALEVNRSRHKHPNMKYVTAQIPL